ncbi:MAG: TraR/DksA family transcriptional regulator [Pseudorhodoplanes sp.]
MEPEPREIEEKFRPLIEAEMAELALRSEHTSEDRKPVELDQQSVGRISRIDALQRQTMANAIEQRRKARLVALDLALRCMAKDEYGYCPDCGEFIGIRRLEIDPAALKCVRCA